MIEFPRRGTGPEDAEAKFSVKDVADASGLPQPVIAQLVSRTWTVAGWMYTAAQMQEAIGHANALRMERGVFSGADGEPLQNRDAMTVAERIAAARSLHPSADLTNRGPVEG